MVAVEPTRAQIATRATRVGRVEQQAVVEVDRLGDRADETIASRAILGHGVVVVAQRDPGPRREAFDGFDEVEVLHLAHERDRVAVRLATEAEVTPDVRVDVERRRLLRVERAEAEVAAADTLQREVLAREGDEVGRVADPSNVLVEDSHEDGA